MHRNDSIFFVLLTNVVLVEYCFLRIFVDMCTAVTHRR